MNFNKKTNQCLFMFIFTHFLRLLLSVIPITARQGKGAGRIVQIDVLRHSHSGKPERLLK